uniref:Uncharacterized protein n=1 Tax=Strigamia maritima TaxID=126957 RepID=T1ISS7_STRMM
MIDGSSRAAVMAARHLLCSAGLWTRVSLARKQKFLERNSTDENCRTQADDFGQTLSLMTPYYFDALIRTKRSKKSGEQVHLNLVDYQARKWIPNR